MGGTSYISFSAVSRSSDGERRVPSAFRSGGFNLRVPDRSRSRCVPQRSSGLGSSTKSMCVFDEKLYVRMHDLASVCVDCVEPSLLG
jgi:hypothetical protein